MFAGTETVWISSDRRTKLVYDKGAGTLTEYVEGVAVRTVDDTPLTATTAEINNAADVDSAQAIFNSLQPGGRPGVPEDIAWGCVYLASDEARFVTGAELVIDGGLLAR